MKICRNTLDSEPLLSMFLRKEVSVSETHISLDLESSVAAMARVGGCWSPSFSPDAKSLAFVSNLNGIPQIWIVAAEGGWPRLVTTLNDQISAVRWSPDGQWLAFRLAPDGGMNEQMYLIHPDGTGLRRLTDGGKETNWLGFWNDDGSKLAFSSNRRNPEGMDAYLVDIASGEAQLVAENHGIGMLIDLSPDERYGILYRLENRSSSDLFLVDTMTGEETNLTPHEGPGDFNSASFADANTLYLTTDLNLDKVAFGRIRLEDGKAGAIEIVLQRENAQLDYFTLTDDGSIAALIWNVAGRSELTLLDLASGQSIDTPALPAEVIYSPVFSADKSLLAFTGTGSATPRNLWIYNLGSKTFSQVTHSSHAGVDLDALIRPELVYFPAHDELELSGWLYRPHNFAAPGAVVLSFHGGPEGQERPIFSSTYQALLAQGIAVFAPNVRGSGGFGKTFVNLDNGALRVNAVRDIKACADYVLSSGIAAPGRIGITGGSYGGYMTMAGLTEYPDLFAAGANLYGIVNFRTFFSHTEPWMAAISKIEYGDPDTEGDMLDQLSPINKIDQIIAPTLVLHGATDTNVPVIEAEQVAENLRQRGIPVEYILFPDEGHGFQKEPNRITSTLAITRWFVQYLT